MYHLLALYARPLRHDEPVVYIDEKSLQLLAHSRAPMAMKPGSVRKEDCEYVRRGTSNRFVAVEPKAGRRRVIVTERRNVKAWEQHRNKQRKPLIGTLTRQRADAKLKRHYVS